MKTERKSSKPKIAYKIIELVEMTGMSRETIEDLIEGEAIQCWTVRKPGNEDTRGARVIPLSELTRLPGFDESLAWLKLATGFELGDEQPDMAREVEELHGRIDRLCERMNRNGLRP